MASLDRGCFGALGAALLTFLAIGCSATNRGSSESCISIAEALKHEKEMKEINEARLDDLLRKEGLTRVRLDPKPVEHTDEALAAHEWHLLERDGKKALLSPQVMEGCGFDAREAFRFAKDARGGLFVIHAAANLRATIRLRLCGCESKVPTTCGGAIPPPVRFELVLPEDVHYEGTKTIAWPIETLQRVFEKDRNDPVCPPMTAPP